ncbi:MAG TPA: gliding motility-associated C-terminal domain-containing protein, partial [Puia sp.]|nr:gliding motility-associated C-terminal domain-containing protein [Puia sp.]
SDAACALPPQVGSNTLSLPAVPVPVQGVGIDASATAICQDSLVQFVAVPDNGGSDPAYQWQVNGVNTGSGPTFSDAGLTNGDVVNCVMTGSLTCSQPVNANAMVTMTVYPLPVITLDSVVIIAGGSATRLMPAVTGDVVRWNWSPAVGLDDASAAEPFASPVITTSYQLYVVTAEGCHSTASELVEVYYPLRMPGAFTPNGDGRNDVFRVPPSSPVTIRYLTVYNRQGARLFYTANVSTGWDGSYNGVSQPAGVYVWELVFDNPLTKKEESRKGTVVLVR